MRTPILTRSITRVLALTFVMSLAAIATFFVAHRRTLSPSDATRVQRQAATTETVKQAYGALPLSFEANQGQTDQRVKYLARGAGYNLFLTPTEAVFSLSTASAAKESDQNERGLARKTSTNEAASTPSSVLTMKLV